MSRNFEDIQSQVPDRYELNSHVFKLTIFNPPSLAVKRLSQMNVSIPKVVEVGKDHPLRVSHLARMKANVAKRKLDDEKFLKNLEQRPEMKSGTV